MSWAPEGCEVYIFFLIFSAASSGILTKKGREGGKFFFVLLGHIPSQIRIPGLG